MTYPSHLLTVLFCIKLHVLFYLLFDILLTVHLSIILVINQLHAQNSCFIISLLYASTYFEHHVLIIRRSKLYYAASDIITPVGGRPVRGLSQTVHRTATYRV